MPKTEAKLKIDLERVLTICFVFTLQLAKYFHLVPQNTAFGQGENSLLYFTGNGTMATGKESKDGNPSPPIHCPVHVAPVKMTKELGAAASQLSQTKKLIHWV